jgi:hypothetical protein
MVNNVNCSYCTESFRFKGDLAKHYSEVHPDIKQPYVCSTCGLGFKRDDNLLAHQNWSHNRKRSAELMAATPAAKKRHVILTTAEIVIARVYTTLSGLFNIYRATFLEKCTDFTVACNLLRPHIQDLVTRSEGTKVSHFLSLLLFTKQARNYSIIFFRQRIFATHELFTYHP